MERNLPQLRKPDRSARRKMDALLKGAFEEIFEFLLRFFYADADNVFDLARGFQFLDKELKEVFPELGRRGGTRHVDMLVKVFRRSGEEEYILLHVEIEGGRSRNMGKRMLDYWTRLNVRYSVDVAAIAVFIGNPTQPRPSSFHKEVLSTSITYRYRTYHIFDHTVSELLAMDNPFATLMAALQSDWLSRRESDEERNGRRMQLARALVHSRKVDGDRINHMVYVIKVLLHIENPEINSNFDQQMDKLIGRTKPMGILETVKMLEREEATEQARYEAKREFVKNLIEQTDFTDRKIAALVTVSVSSVRKIRAELKRQQETS